MRISQKRTGPLAIFLAALTIVVHAACGDPAGPADSGLTLAVRSGDAQFGSPGMMLVDPLEVLVLDRRGEPLPGASVTWRVVEGTGAKVDPATSTTDSAGLARTRLTLGPGLGEYRVEAVMNRSEARVVFVAKSVLTPAIAGVEPASVNAGETVRITGENFSPEPADNVVLFGGMRGEVRSASSTELEVEVPRCVPGRSVPVTVQLGPVTSDPVQIEVNGAAGPVLGLAVGQSVTLSSAQDLGCLRLPGSQPNAAYLLVLQNVADVPDRPMLFQLAGLTGQATSPPQVRLVTEVPGGELQPAGLGAFSSAWELELRARELEIDPRDVIRPPEDVGLLATTAPPAVGDRRNFRVLDKNGRLVTVTAEVKHVSERAILYQDLDAPAGGFTPQDFAAFGQFFDDPIYDAVVSVFGEPSDIDQNGRIIILFTPVVNAMTPRGSDGFISGFFYGLDLTTQSGSNRAEIFYSMVPDPAGKFSDSRSAEQVLRVTPPVLAHEFQHMIHFNQRVMKRGVGVELLWLSEALAHMAEDVVGQVFRARGDNANADRFQTPNYVRASRFLVGPHQHSVISVLSPGTLEERGAQWLLLKYLAGHYGGNDFLRRITQTTRSGVNNLTSETGQTWSRLFGDWATAIWASGAPEFQGVEVEPRHSYVDFELRRELARFQLPSIRYGQVGFDDFVIRETLGSSSAMHLLVRAPQNQPRPLHLHLGARWGGAFGPDDRPQLTVIRVR